MKRAINKEIVTRLRLQKGWSQEELALASGLSARTVQRLEAEGGGSVSSIKSLASALEVNMHNLEEKPRTDLVGVRWGYAGVIVGTSCGVIGVMANWLHGAGGAFEAGLGLGVIGLLAGTSCAFIGWSAGRG
ncbi:MAG: helix-turn-helix transcriptional regulator [Pseudomonadota bacterium]